MKLEIGQSKDIIVCSREHYSGSIILDVASGEKYDFSTINGDKWVDTFIPCGADGNSYGLFRKYLRLKNSPYFMLCCSIGEDDTCLFPIGGTKENLEMPASGKLYFFANDIWHFYWNNFGSITVRITRKQ